MIAASAAGGARHYRAIGRNALARHERYVVGLDIGTSKVCTVVGELLDAGGVDVIGLGVAESKGLKRGVVVNSSYSHITESPPQT